MKPGPVNITELILSELALDAPPEALEDVIHRIITDHKEWKIDPEEKTALWAGDVKKRLSIHLNQCNALSKQPHFSFNSSSDYKIQGACFIELAISMMLRNKNAEDFAGKNIMTI